MIGFILRRLNYLIGAGFAGVLVLGLAFSVYGMIATPEPATAEHEFHKHPKELALASDGPLGKFDRQQVQRGFQVYKEVCSACHSLRQVAFRDLEHIGYSEGQVKAIAAAWQTEQPSLNPETGEPATRKNVASDKFPSPFANEVAARAANNNALPPDLSLMTKARHDGPAYVYSLLTGYQAAQPAKLVKHFPGSVTPSGLYYNPYFANLNLAMPPPLTSDGQVSYADGTPATVDQMAKDVAAFLTWTAEPNLEARHTVGWAAALFLLVFVFLAWGAYQNVWRDIEH